MSIIVYNEVGTPIIPAGDLAGPVRDALGGALRSMRYASSDFAGLYQDAAGTTPATAVGQPVGLMLDRRFGRGAEMMPADPEWNLSSNPTAIVSGHRVEALVNGNIITTIGSANGRNYEVAFDVVQTGPLGMQVFVGGIVGPISFGAATPVGRVSGIKTMSSGSRAGEILFGGNNAGWIIDNISVRELPGNHASQTTTTARPTLHSGPLRIDYDGVDDYLRTVFSDLGSDVTIARSIPGVGAQILTGQTIAAGNWDDNVTSCATLVIDRSLTGPETALVTAYLNQQAGV